MFDNFELDTDSFELRRDGDILTVEPKVFELLSYLMAHRDRMVSKDELFEQVWRGRIVSDSALSSQIKAARRVLGDDGRKQLFLKTIHGRGFRFVGDVETTVDPGSRPPAAQVPELGDKWIGHLPLPDKPSIAVLPFENMSGDPEQEYFSDGITEDIITEISKISGLFVIARHSSFVYKEKLVSVKQVGQDLGVRYVLEGSVRKAGNRLRITAQLSDSGSEHHLWVERYDRNLEDVFAVQEEVARKVAEALEVRLAASEQEKAVRRYTDNLEAYDSFLLGRAYQARSTRDSNSQAREVLERAIELDPGFAGAYAILSHTHWRDWRNQWSGDPDPLERALEAAQKAVALDDSLPLAHTCLAWVLVFRKEYEEAIAEGRRAISLDPNFAEGYARLGLILSLAGEPEEALGSVQQAMRLNPHYPPSFILYLGHAYYSMGKLEEAITALRKSLTGNPEALGCRLLLAVIHSELGHTEEAEAQVAEVSRISPRASVEHLKDCLAFKDQALSERYLDALHKAGLPEQQTTIVHRS